MGCDERNIHPLDSTEVAIGKIQDAMIELRDFKPTGPTRKEILEYNVMSIGIGIEFKPAALAKWAELLGEPIDDVREACTRIRKELERMYEQIDSKRATNEDRGYIQPQYSTKAKRS